MPEQSENVENAIDSDDDVPQLPENFMLECSNEDCPGDDDSFTILIEHELQRKQDVEEEASETHLKQTNVRVIICDHCRVPTYGEPIVAEDREQQTTEGPITEEG